MATDKITGVQKAAIMLLAMGEEFTASFFQKLDERTIKRIGKKMSEISYVPAGTMNVVLKEFTNNFENDQDFCVSGKSFLKDVVNKSLDENTAREVCKTIDNEISGKPFSELAYQPAQNLVNQLKGEHPQTIALILSHVTEDKAAELLCLFPNELKADIAYRLLQVGDVKEDVIHELDAVIKKNISGVETTTRDYDGLEVLANILNEVDNNTESQIMDSIEKEDDELAEMIRQKMFVFEDLVQVDNKSFRQLLQSVENEVVVKALKTASEEMKKKIFENMSERASEMLQEELEYLGPVRLAEVEESQQSIIRIAKKLETEGQIVLVAKGKDDVFV